MHALFAALVFVSAGLTPPPPAAAEPEFLRALDRFYTWGDLVERFTCRVHGRWLDYRGARARSGQYWGDLDYRDGAFRFTLVRTLGPPPDPATIRDTLHTLIEQAGLLPSGFPVPAGPIRRRATAADSTGVTYEAAYGDGRESSGIRYRVDRGRVTEVSMPGDRRRTRLAFRIKSHWIPGDRYLITQLVGRSSGRTSPPRVAYQYHYLAGQYFPRAITEDRPGTRLSLLLYGYEIDMVG